MKIRLTEQFYQHNSYTHRYDELFNQILDLDENHYCSQADKTLEPGEYTHYQVTEGS